MVEPTESESLAELDRFCDAMIAIRGEIAQVEQGAWPQDDNPLKNAPHTAASLLASDWAHAYTREQAAYPGAQPEARQVLEPGGPHRQRARRPQPVLQLPTGQRLRLSWRNAVAVSVFDLFKIGIGPSSSHTVGPMRAARLFVARLLHDGQLAATARVQAQLYGSLGATGKGHGSDKAVLLGLAGHEPDTVDVDAVPALLAAMRGDKRIALLGQHGVAFNERDDLKFHRRETLPFHTNGLRFTAFDAAGGEIVSRVYYSVGGGFVVSDEVAADGQKQKVVAPDTTLLPLPFRSGEELLVLTRREGCSIAEVMRRNERHWRPDAQIDAGLLKIWQVMQDCVARGCATDGVLPGGFQVKRRAAPLKRALTEHPEQALRDPLQVLDWINLYALAVNEENAAGGRVVTAPTNARPALCRRCCTTTGALCTVPATPVWSISCSPPPRSASSTRKTPASAVPRSVARARWAWPAAWPPVRCARCWAARPSRWKRRRDRHGAPPGPHLRPGGRAGADPVHRAQRHRLREGHQCRAHGAARRRHALRQPGQGHQDHARDRRRHDEQVQGDGARRAGGEHRRVLNPRARARVTLPAISH